MEAAAIAHRCARSTVARSSRLRPPIINSTPSQSCLSAVSRTYPVGRRKHSRDISFPSTRQFTTSRFRSQDGQASPAPANAEPQPPPASSSSLPLPARSKLASDLLSGPGGILSGGLRVPNTGETTSPSSAFRPTSPPGSSLLGKRDLLDIMSEQPLPSPTRALSQEVARQIERDLAPMSRNMAVSMRLKPTLGRTLPIDVTRNIDVGMAFRLLERKCAQNNVKTDARNQRVYVRRGQRRKEERMKRWRALFKEGYLNECGRIRRMKAQGW